MTISDRIEPPAPACPRCGSASLFLIVPMSEGNPWDWYRCHPCGYEFTPEGNAEQETN